MFPLRTPSVRYCFIFGMLWTAAVCLMLNFLRGISNSSFAIIAQFLSTLLERIPGNLPIYVISDISSSFSASCSSFSSYNRLNLTAAFFVYGRIVSKNMFTLNLSKIQIMTTNPKSSMDLQKSNKVTLNLLGVQNNMLKWQGQIDI